MKTREEMIQNVYRRIEKYTSEKVQKKKRAAKTAAVAVPILAAAAAIALWRGGVFTPARTNAPLSAEPIPTSPSIPSAQPSAPPVASSPTQTTTRTQDMDSGDCLGSVTINGVYYLQTSDPTRYTPDVFLGNGGDFEGTYRGDTKIRFYTAKENPAIVIVIFFNDTQLNLIKTDWNGK